MARRGHRFDSGMRPLQSNGALAQLEELPVRIRRMGFRVPQVPLMGHSYNGSTPALQAGDTGSNPVCVQYASFG